MATQNKSGKNRSQRERRNLILTISVTAVIFVVAGIGAFFSSRGDKVAPNPAGTIGNTAGNINAGGLFCEHDGYVYFSNPYDGGALYRMTPLEEDLEKLSANAVTNILAGGSFLYYFSRGSSGQSGLGGVRMPMSFSRCKLDGTKSVSLLRAVVTSGQLVGDWLYLQTASENEITLTKIKTDKTGEKKIADYLINPAAASGSSIYYVGTVSDHNLYRLNTPADTSSLVLEGNIWNPIPDGDYIYFMAPADGYQLQRYSLSRAETEVLTTERVSEFNEANGYIYYQTMGDAPHLVRMYSDGSEPAVVAEGNYTAIHITSRYVYFQNALDTTAIYHCPLGGFTSEPFAQARRAALENMQED